MTPSPLEAVDAVADVGVKLSTGERLTLVMLARRYPNSHPGLSRLARETGSDRANVGRRLDGLVTKGLVRAFYRLPDGRHVERPASGADRAGRGGREGRGGARLGSTVYLLRLPGLPLPELPEGADPWPDAEPHEDARALASSCRAQRTHVAERNVPTLQSATRRAMEEQKEGQVGRAQARAAAHEGA